jgi:hypothetical protein
MLCVERGFQRLKGDASVTISNIVANSILALVVGTWTFCFRMESILTVIGSIFYNLKDSTTDFNSRAVLLFFAVLLNAFASALEVMSRYLVTLQLLTLVDSHSIRSTSYCRKARQIRPVSPLYRGDFICYL